MQDIFLAVAVVPASTLDVVGDVASLVTVHPLEPPVQLPDTTVAWRVNPPPKLHATVSLARETARLLYAG